MWDKLQLSLVYQCFSLAEDSVFFRQLAIGISAFAGHPLFHFLQLSTMICFKNQPSSGVLKFANCAEAS